MYTHTLRCFILLTLFFPALAPAADVSYSGSYSGSFTGTDQGTWTATISTTGVMSGTAISTIDSSSMTISSQGAPDGAITKGAVITGATFLGSVNLAAGTISGTWSNLFTGNSGTWSGAVIPVGQTVTAGTAPTIAVGGTGVLSATATSSLAVSFSSTTPSICSVSDTTVKGIAEGTCTIAANQTGNPYYNPAPTVTFSFSVSPPTLSVSNSGGSGTGLVTSADSKINCGVTCSSSYNANTVVYLTAAPDSGSTFTGWSGACSGTGVCPVTMDASKTVTAVFNPAPFTVDATGVTGGIITTPIATVKTTIEFSPADKGKQGAVFITARVPARVLGVASPKRSLRSTAQMNTTSPSSLLLVQLTVSGWQQVQNGQLLPYATGVFGDQLASQTILNNTDISSLGGSQFCLGYGETAEEMTAAGRMQLVATIPNPSATNSNTRSCNVTLPITDNQLFAYAEANYASIFPLTATSGTYLQFNYRLYPTGNYLAVDTSKVVFVYGPVNAYTLAPVGSVESFRGLITAWEDTLPQ